MICQICQEQNDADDIFCRSCGNSLSQGTQPTVVLNVPSQQTQVPFQNSQVFPAQHYPSSNNKVLYALIGVLLCTLVGAGIYFGTSIVKKNTLFPDHFGVFARKDDSLRELPKKELKDFIKEKASLLEQESNPILNSKPEIIVFSDSGIPVDKLKLVSLDSIKDDGTYQFTDFQVSPVEGKSDIKELRVSQRLANGKYAFTIFDGFINEGNHKFWSFQVSNSDSSENTALQSASLGLKPTPTPTSVPVITVIAPPENARIAFCNNRNVLIRSSPSLAANPIGKLQKGQTLYVINTSSNYDNWQGIYSNWAYVQLPNGKKGWMFNTFVSYR
jgi:Bacterial SH3 domain